ncbi:unnamed protein product, partial [Mesorhabditis belari]|uniref:Uncharacterized protein n=1 Tax=Mesorhabditis belari TaxID=2138241 RepID=A0AAF3FRN7_9BILA
MRIVFVFAVFFLAIESARTCWSGNSFTDSLSWSSRKSQTCSCGKGCAKYYNVDQQQWYWGCSCFYDYNQQKDVEYCPNGVSERINDKN